MTTFTAQDLEERLLDYVYDELEPAERAAFEAALPSAPAIAAEVDAMRLTREAMAELRAPTLPSGFDAGMASVFAEADTAAAGFREAAQLPAAGAAPEGAPAKAAPARGPGFWARLGQRLAAGLATPAFATAAVALVVTGVAVTMAKKGELPGEDRSGSSQVIGAVAPVTVGAEAPTAAPAADEVAKASAPEAAVALAADTMDRPADEAARGGALGQTTDSDRLQLDDSIASGAGEKGSSPAKKLEIAKKPTTRKDAVSNKGRGDSDAPREPLDGLMASGGGGEGGLKASNIAEPPSGQVAAVADDAEPLAFANEARPSAEAPARPAPPPPSASSTAEVARRVRTASSDSGAGAPAPDRYAPAPAADKVAVQKVAEDAEREESAAEREDDAAESLALRIDGLWTTLRRQLEAGDLDGADLTLTELTRLGADAARIKAARADVADARARAAEEAAKKATKKVQEVDAPHPATRSTK